MNGKKTFSLNARFTDKLFYCLLQFYESLKITVKGFSSSSDCPLNHNKKEYKLFYVFLIEVFKNRLMTFKKQNCKGVQRDKLSVV